jgi:hypothetical protein
MRHDVLTIIVKNHRNTVSLHVASGEFAVISKLKILISRCSETAVAI